MQDPEVSEHNLQSETPVSVVILAKNEAVNIRRCIEAVNWWCDDILVVDDHSTDDTVKIAESCGARVVNHEFASFAAQRNWAMVNCEFRHDWILHLDADEVGTVEFHRGVQQAVQLASQQCSAFKLCRKTMLMGQWLKYSDGFPVWIMRLVRRGAAEFEDSGHGEVAVPDVDGDVREIREPFCHFAFSKGLSNWIERHNRYSSCEAALEAEHARRIRWSGLLSRDKAMRRYEQRKLSRQLPFRPTLRFLYQYVLKFGFLDGRAGWEFSRMMATYEGWIVAKRNELLYSDVTVALPFPETLQREAAPLSPEASKEKAA
jgi:glycosyltransferase involved in cell wall biosynthesis